VLNITDTLMFVNKCSISYHYSVTKLQEYTVIFIEVSENKMPRKIFWTCKRKSNKIENVN
jgi:hypothetical protein